MANVFLLVVVALFFYIAHSDTSIKAQIFCDNFCKVYFNGELVYEDTERSRVVDTFTINNVPETGTRTFAVWLGDNPYDSNEGIWNYESPTFLAGQTDEGGDIIRQWCLGDGGFRGIFTDTQCGNAIVVSSSAWKCNSIVSGPRDIEACFPNWNEDSTSPTFGGVGDIYPLFDPCIRSSDESFAPDWDNCDCTQDFNEDYVNFADRWFKTGYDDSNWVAATTYTETEAVPKLGRLATQTFEECSTGFYCDREMYPVSSWGDSEFIWSDKLELDNVVLCRYEYELSTCDEAEDDDDNDDDDDDDASSDVAAANGRLELSDQNESDQFNIEISVSDTTWMYVWCVVIGACLSCACWMYCKSKRTKNTSLPV